jgi:thiamine-monophosphate kinase
MKSVNQRSSPPGHPSAEHALLERLKRYIDHTPSRRYPIGIGDDCAVRAGRDGEALVLTTDSLVEDVHFTLSTITFDELGRKAMAVNLSDCAAMGAEPESALVDIVFPTRGRNVEARIRGIYQGFRQSCRRYGHRIVGGNLSAGPCWVISITLIGRMSAGRRPLLRTGARPGDGLWVSGQPGEAAAGLAALKRWARPRVPQPYRPLVRRHLAPVPRVKLGGSLAGDAAVHCLIDISDGISKDASTLGFENRLGIALDAGHFPASAAMKRLSSQLGLNWQDWFLHGGEDYELLFAAGPAFDPERHAHAGGVRLTRVGAFLRAPQGLFVADAHGRHRVALRGWDHLRACTKSSPGRR